GRLFVGSVVVALGAIYLLDYAGALDAGDVIATWWPVVLIGAAVMALIANPGHWMTPAIVAAVGAMILLRTTEVIDSLAIVGPILLMAVGLMVIFGRGFGQRLDSRQNRISSFNIFSGSEIASHSDRFEGGSIGALFGGTEIDLRDAQPAPGAKLDVFVAFGGAEIKVPQGWHVITHGMPIFGGFENVTAKEAVPADAPVLDINATVLFGGLEVKH
ncbi:MAG: LiaF transmembrane domain-containing protein, partial [Acidimicrobiia bacterium]